MAGALEGVRVIGGHDGPRAALMAIERGEVVAHISGGPSAAFRARYRPWEKAGERINEWLDKVHATSPELT